MDMGFVPIKAQVYLQDLTQSAAEIYGTYKTTIDPFVQGGNRLKYIWAHTHMDQTLITRLDILAYIQFLKSDPYKYSVVSLSECLGDVPYTNSINAPQNQGPSGSSGEVSSAFLLYLIVANLL
eukprot:NODE_276_length_10970_cov_0.627909.p13 type:complete len:123 gc:universal NODE_276_length_10970_cov_0.627909:7966-7598(-)